MKVRYTDTAASEIRNIVSYISAHNVSAADVVLAQIEHTIELLAGHPMLGPIKYEGRVRMSPVRHYPQCLLFYPIEREEIVVLNLRHAARRRPWRDSD